MQNQNIIIKYRQIVKKAFCYDLLVCSVIIKPLLDALGILSVSAISFLSGCTVLSMTTYSAVKSKVSGNSKFNIKTGIPLAIGAASMFNACYNRDIDIHYIRIRLKPIKISILIIMAIGGIAGGICGRSINKKISEKTVDKLFIGLMIVMIIININNII